MTWDPSLKLSDAVFSRLIEQLRSCCPPHYETLPTWSQEPPQDPRWSFKTQTTSRISVLKFLFPLQPVNKTKFRDLDRKCLVLRTERWNAFLTTIFSIRLMLHFLSVSDPCGWDPADGPECFAVWNGDGGGREADPARHGVQSGPSVHLPAERQTGKHTKLLLLSNQKNFDGSSPAKEKLHTWENLLHF